jgi:hypothetical protein
MGDDFGRGDYLHDLRVLVSGVRVALDDLAVVPGQAEAVREDLCDRIDLIVELLRVLRELEGGVDDRVQVVDARALVWLARSRHPHVFMGRMPSAVWVRTNVQAALELLDVVVTWVEASAQRVRLVAVARPASLFVIGAPNDVAQGPSPLDREMEQTIQSLAGAARVEASLRESPRTAKLDLVSADEDI